MQNMTPGEQCHFAHNPSQLTLHLLGFTQLEIKSGSLYCCQGTHSTSLVFCQAPASSCK